MDLASKIDPFNVILLVIAAGGLVIDVDGSGVIDDTFPPRRPGILDSFNVQNSGVEGGAKTVVLLFSIASAHASR